MFGLKISRIALLSVVVLIQSCASSAPLYNARAQFFNGQPEAALQTLENDSVSKRNTLLAYLDEGLIAHTAGEYQTSINAFLKANELLERLDFISVKEQSTSLITNDWATSYKGEASEKLWIHTFQMMNFLLIDQPEGAAVEARQALSLLEDHEDTLNSDWYTRALIAMSFEAANQPDSAHVEYKKLFEDLNGGKGIARRAWQNANRLGRIDDAKEFKRAANLHSGERADTSTGADHIDGGNTFTVSTATDNKAGELILFLQTSSIPVKQAGHLYISPTQHASFPIYPSYRKPHLLVDVGQDDVRTPADIINVQLVDLSRSALAARGKRVAAKQLLRLVAKRNIAKSASKESELLGSLLTVAFLVTEVADTRSWETLPAHLSLVQVPLEEGKQSIVVTVFDGSITHELLLSDIDIEAGKKTYRSVRIGAGAPLEIAHVQN